MPDVLRDAFGSKKFLVFLATVIVAVGNKLAGHFGYELDPDTVNQFIAIAGAYIVGQGIADHGKEAAKVVADAARTPPPMSLPAGLDSGAAIQAKRFGGFVRLPVLLAFAAVGLIVLGSGCSSPTVKNVEGNVIACSKAELATATSGTSVITVAVETAAAIAAAVATGGLEAALTAIEVLIAKYGEPIVACAVTKGASQPDAPKPMGLVASGKTNMVDLVFDTHRSLARQVVQHYGWKVSP